MPDVHHLVAVGGGDLGNRDLVHIKQGDMRGQHAVFLEEDPQAHGDIVIEAADGARAQEHGGSVALDQPTAPLDQRPGERQILAQRDFKFIQHVAQGHQPLKLLSIPHAKFVKGIGQLPSAPLPSHHDGHQDGGHHHGEVSATGELQQVAEEEQQVDQHQRRADRQDLPQRPVPAVEGDIAKRESGDSHRACDGDAIRRRQIPRCAEQQGHRHAAKKHRPIHEGDVDLPFGVAAGVPHGMAGRKTKHNGLFHDREHTGDQRLGGDERRDRRDQQVNHQNHPVDRGVPRGGGQGIERVGPGRNPLFQQVAHLSGIVQHQAGEHNIKPGEHHRAPPRVLGIDALPFPQGGVGVGGEVANVGVLRLAPGDRQHHHPENHKRPDPWEVHQELQRIQRVQGGKHLGMPQHPGQPLEGNPGKPHQQHEPPKQSADLAGPPPLRLEQHEQTDQRGPQRHLLAERFIGTQHGDGRSDDAIGRQQSSGADHQKGQRRHPGDLASVSLQQSPQGEGSPFPPVVSLHDQQVVLDRQEDQRPEDEAEAAQGVGPGYQVGPPLGDEGIDFVGGEMMVPQVNGLAGDFHHRVQDRCADIAIHRPRGLPHAGHQAAMPVGVRLDGVGGIVVMGGGERRRIGLGLLSPWGGSGPHRGRRTSCVRHAAENPEGSPPDENERSQSPRDPFLSA